MNSYILGCKPGSVLGLLLISITLFCLPNQSQGQATNANNNPAGGAFLGFNAGQDLDFKTDNILRMQLMQTQTNTINGFPAISQDGYLGLSDELNFFNPGGTGPFSMLHLNGDNSGSNPQQLGWRPWMKYGMTVTSNRDLMYVGHLDRGTTDQTDAVITWSDNTFGEPGPDNLRFLFSSGDGQATCGNTSEYGLEAGRFSGEGKFGCGDFSPCGADEQPTHQLDVNGDARVRDVPVGPADVLITGHEVDQIGDYSLRYLAFSGDAGEVLAGDGTWIDGSAALCDWNIVNAGLDVATGYPGACVPRNVGIGALPPNNSKLFVTDVLDFNDNGIEVNTTATGTVATGIRSEIVATAPQATIITGVYGSALNSKAPYGGLFEAEADGLELSQPAVGVMGHATSVGPTAGSLNNNAIGVYGLGTSSINCDRPIGVYGQAVNTTGCANPIAGYFAGALVFNQTPIVLSDESIKSDINEIENASEILEQLIPKSYNFIPDANSPNAYSSDLNFGFLAQQVQDILPNIVQAVPAPIHLNEEGEIISSDEDLLGIQYGQLIPILVAGFQEQQQQIGALEDVIDSQNQTLAQVLDQLDDLQQQINNCCSADGAKSFGSSEENPKPDLGENILHQNNPNPFRSQTTISYELEQGGKVTLNIFDKNGKPLATLVEAEQQAGEYRYEWDASGLPAGVYNYALYVDGELLVKKAIKLAD